MRPTTLIAAGVATATLLACGGSQPQRDVEPAAIRPGSPAVYAEIAAVTDCTELQAGFDRNMDDRDRRNRDDPLRAVVTAYAAAYEARRVELGC